jgi:hypothetical protein
MASAGSRHKPEGDKRRQGGYCWLAHLIPLRQNHCLRNST